MQLKYQSIPLRHFLYKSFYYKLLSQPKNLNFQSVPLKLFLYILIFSSVCISLEAAVDDTRTQIELTYQAYNASWTPSYDIRVSTAGKEPLLKLLYYGNIRQSTGEDWTDVNLILSTAQPRAGGQLPSIGTLQAQFYKPVAQPMMMKRSMKASGIFGSAAQQDLA